MSEAKKMRVLHVMTDHNPDDGCYHCDLLGPTVSMGYGEYTMCLARRGLDVPATMHPAPALCPIRSAPTLESEQRAAEGVYMLRTLEDWARGQAKFCTAARAPEDAFSQLAEELADVLDMFPSE